MLYNVAQLLKEGVGASRRRTIAGDLRDIDALNPGVTHVEGELLFVRTPRGILVTGNARMTIHQICRRCLEPMVTDVEFEIEEEFIPSIDIDTGATLPITDEDEGHHRRRALFQQVEHQVILVPRGGDDGRRWWKRRCG